MNCKKIQELLKIDYLDGEVNQREEEYIKEHLANCAECFRLEKELQAQRMFFKKVKQQEVPGRVWQNIRDRIITESLDQEEGVSRGILEQLKESIWGVRPVFALASVFAVVIFVTFFASAVIERRQSVSRDDSIEGIMDYRLNGEDNDLFYSMGTNVEEYFL